MTIDESKTILTTHREHWEYLLSEGICDAHEGKKAIGAFTMAIASLEAWDKVRQEIGKLSLSWEYGQGVVDCLAIIDHYMQEVGNGQTE